MTDTTPGALGRYEIQGILGKGAMGVVYKARDPLIGRVLAIKTFRTAYLGDDEDAREFRARFLREAQSAGILNHPNIVTIHDVVEASAEGVTFIAMEYVEGTNLKEILRQGEALELPRISNIVSEVADALDYAHDKGVIHRDIKPANILLTKQGRVKLTDFGIARLEASDLTQDGQLLGTPNYMAPERILGREVDRRTDVFSLGVVLYEMLTGRKPFQGDNLTMVTHRIVYEPFTPPAELDLDVPREVIRVLQRSMAKEPFDRFATAGEMAAELELAVHLAVDSGFSGIGTVVRDVESEDEAATQDVIDHVGETAASAGEDREKAPDVKAPDDEEVTPDGWAGEPPGGSIEGDATLVAKVPDLLQGTDSPPSALPPMPASAPSAAAGPSAVAARSLSWLRGLSPRALVVAAALVAAVGLVALVAAFWPARDGPVEPAPAEIAAPEQSPVRDRYVTEAREAMDRGEVGRADRYIRQGLVVAPDDPELHELRREVGAALTEAELSADRETQIAAWLESARLSLESRQLDAAEATLGRLLLVEPENEAALELQERIAAARTAAASERRRQEARRESARAAAEEAAGAEEPVAESIPEEPEASHFELAVVFLTEISQGTLTIYADEQQIVRESFDFRKRTGLFKVQESSGQITASRRLPRGERMLRIYVGLDGRPPVVETVRHTFRGGTEPTLRIVVRGDGGVTVAIE
jgi:serine/threonine protein kinase